MPVGSYTRRVYDLKSYRYRFVNWIEKWTDGGYEPKFLGELLYAGFKENA